MDCVCLKYVDISTKEFTYSKSDR